MYVVFLNPVEGGIGRVGFPIRLDEVMVAGPPVMQNPVNPVSPLLTGTVYSHENSRDDPDNQRYDNPLGFRLFHFKLLNFAAESGGIYPAGGGGIDTARGGVIYSDARRGTTSPANTLILFKNLRLLLVFRAGLPGHLNRSDFWLTQTQDDQKYPCPGLGSLDKISQEAQKYPVDIIRGKDPPHLWRR